MAAAKDNREKRLPSRRPARHTPYRSFRSKSKYSFHPAVRVLLVSAGILVAVIFWACISRAFAPRGNTNRHTFDAIIVLGTPADSDGNPTPQMLDRVTEAVHEYERGSAPRLIFSGAAAHNRFVEAEVMARIAKAQGVPPSVIFEEPQALDTIQNACYSAHILKSHGWHSAEVVTSPFHVPRAAMIFSHLSIEWRLHTAPDNLTPGSYSHMADLAEILKTARYLIWARWIEPCAS